MSGGVAAGKWEEPEDSGDGAEGIAVGEPQSFGWKVGRGQVCTEFTGGPAENPEHRRGQQVGKVHLPWFEGN